MSIMPKGLYMQIHRQQKMANAEARTTKHPKERKKKRDKQNSARASTKMKLPTSHLLHLCPPVWPAAAAAGVAGVDDEAENVYSHDRTAKPEDMHIEHEEEDIRNKNARPEGQS